MNHPTHPIVPQGTQLPEYVSHKTVRAARIVSAMPGSIAGTWFLALELPGEPYVEVKDEWIERRLNGQSPSAAIGGWFIQYGDGYTSWRPAAGWEDEYTPAAQWGLSVTQEPKYTVNLKGKLINRASGKPIPDDEPIWITRGQDTIGRRHVEHYRDVAEADSFSTELIDNAGRRAMDFALFAGEHPERMKDPD